MKNKNNILIVIGIILVLLGSLLPSIRIAQENISFIKENGILIIILVVSMFLLFKLNYKQLIYIPSILSLLIIVKFIIDNKERIEKINKLYNCYATYKYGIVVMILGNLLIIGILIYDILNKPTKEKIKTNTKNIINTIKEKTNKIKLQEIKEKLKLKKPKIIHETTKDGKIKFNKITVKCDKPKINKRIKNKKIQKLSILKFKENKKQTKQIHEMPVIDIQKWTQSDICCSNCGATVHTTSEYCFLCDCKIKLKQEQEKLS